MESTIIPSPLSTPREDFLLSLKHLLDLGCLLSATASSGCKITRTLKYIFWLNAFSHITKRSDQSCFLILGGETISCYTDFKNTLEKMQLISEDCSKTWWHNSDTGVGRCVRTCGQWKRREVVIIILKKKKDDSMKKSLRQVVRAGTEVAVRHSFHTFLARGHSSLSQWTTGPKWHAALMLGWLGNASMHLESQCQAWLFKDLHTLRRQEQPPNSFQKGPGPEGRNVCLHVHVRGGALASVQDWLIHVLGSEACEVVLSHHRSDPVEVELTSHHKRFVSPLPWTHNCHGRPCVAVHITASGRLL